MVDLLTAQVADAKKAVTDAEAKIAAAEEAKKTAATAAENAVKAAAAKVEAAKGLTADRQPGRSRRRGMAADAPLVKAAEDALARVPAGIGKGSAERRAENAGRSGQETG